MIMNRPSNYIFSSFLRYTHLNMLKRLFRQVPVTLIQNLLY